MAFVILRQPLKDLAGSGRVEVAAPTVGAARQELERLHPRVAGWATDERGSIRPHVNVFIDGERASEATAVNADTEVFVIGAISGGSEDAELLVGTRKGLFVLGGQRGGPMEIAARLFEGQDVPFAMRDRRSGRYFAAATHGQYGPRLWWTEDLSGDWEQADGPRFPADTGAGLTAIWLVREGIEDDVLWAGVAPAALFKSEDSGTSWSLVRGLWDEPSRPRWQGGAGGLCLHSVSLYPGEPRRLSVAISAAGVWHTENGGESWRRGIRGLVPRYLPEDARADSLDLCVHNMHRSPVEPETLYMQFHGGVYRSDDGGESWMDIGLSSGLPSDFGFPMVVHPRAASRAFVIPLVSDADRVTPEGAVAVYETRDRGNSWAALRSGLPQSNAYLTVLRQAFCHDTRDPLGLYFGATSGEVFGSADDGNSWTTVARRLAPVLSVRCSG